MYFYDEIFMIYIIRDYPAKATLMAAPTRNQDESLNFEVVQNMAGVKRRQQNELGRAIED